MTPAAKVSTFSGESESDSPIRYGSMIVAGILIIIALYCRVRLLSLPLERDEGGFAYIGQQMLHGVPPFESGNMKVLGGIHFAYAVMIALFGEHARGIHTGLLLVNMTSMSLMYFIARRMFTVEAALLTTGAYAYLSTSQAVLGVAAHATHFVMLFVLAGVVLLFKGVEKNSRSLFFVSGLSFGLAILMKQHGVFFAIFGLSALVWKRHNQDGGKKAIMIDLTIMGGGIVVPYLAICLYMLVNGVFGEFWFWTVTRSFNYVSTNTLSQGLQNLQHRIAPQYFYLKYAWLLGGIGLLASTLPNGSIREQWFLPGFFLSALLATMPGGMFYWHYFVLIIPALALLIGAAFETLCRVTVTVSKPGATGVVAVSVIALAFATCIYPERDYLFSLSPDEVSRKLYVSDLFVVSDEIARYIRENSDSRAKLAIIGSEPQIYFNARRSAATDYLFMYGLDTPHEYLTKMQDEMIGEIEKTGPEYIVYVGAYDSWFTGNAGERILNWLNNYLVYYKRVGFVDLRVKEDSNCSWGAEAENCLATAEQYVSIFKRSY